MIIIILPAILKLFFLDPARLFEPHVIALEMIDSGEFRYWMNGGYNFNYQFPIYPTILYLIYSAGLGPFGALVFNVLLGAGSTFFTYRIAQSLSKGGYFANTIPLLAALAVSIHPFFAYYQVKMVHPFALDMFFLLWLLCLSINASIADRKSIFLLGLLGGLALLNRPTTVMAMLPFLLRGEWLAFFRSRNVGTLIMFTMLLLIPVSGWLIRNYQIYDQVTLNSSIGQNLWIGIQEETEGTAQLPDGNSYMTLLNDDERDYLDRVGPMQESSFFIEKFKSELSQDPSLWFEMMVLKFKNFWFFRSSLGVDHGDLVTRPVRIVHRVSSFLLFVFAFSSFLLRKKQISYVMLSVIALSLLQAIFYVETRHKLLVDPILIICSLIFIAHVIGKNKEHLEA